MFCRRMWRLNRKKEHLKIKIRYSLEFLHLLHLFALITLGIATNSFGDLENATKK